MSPPSSLFINSSTNVSILHPFQDIISFTGYLTAGDLETSFSVDTTFKRTGHVQHPSVLYSLLSNTLSESYYLYRKAIVTEITT